MNPSSVDIKDYLESFAIASFGTDLFISKMPDSPDLCICLYDTAGEAPDPTMEIPHLMVHIRGGEGQYITGYAKAKEVFDALSGLSNEELGSTHYVGVWAISDITSLGYDDKNRPLFSMNFRIERQN